MNNEKPWSKEEIELLASGLSNREISERTGRSQPAIRGKRQRLARKVTKTTIKKLELLDTQSDPWKDDPQVATLNVGDVWMDTSEGIGKMWSGFDWVKMTPEETMKHFPTSKTPIGPGGQLSAAACIDLVGKPFPANAGNTIDAPTYEADKARAQAEFWKREHDTLKRKYERSLREQTALEQLVASVKELAPVSYSPLPPVHRVSAGKGKPQSAVLFLSDTHVGQTITREQTMGFGEYDFEIFLARLKFYEEAVTSIMRDHTTTELTELVIAMGGDMLHGALNHSAEAAQQHTLFQQFYGAGHAFAQFIRNLAPLIPQVRVFCTVGNHTRWGNQHKMPTDNRYSNLDSFCYAYTEALTRDIQNVSWQLDKQPNALFEVQGFSFQLMHGDSLRGGDRALGIPNHAVGRMVSQSAQLFGKAGKPSPHYYLVGHLHREIVLPHARGSVIVNGGFPGLDSFGLSAGFSPVDPKQIFFMVHPRYGKTACYDIELKFAKVGEDRPYSIPSFI